MTDYFTAPDGADEPTIWERTDGDPAVVVRRAELPGPHADLLWRVLTGVLCADDETVERVAQSLFRSENGKHWELLTEDVRLDYLMEARAALAVLPEGR